MVKTRRRNYSRVRFMDEGEANDVTDESGGSEGEAQGGESKEDFSKPERESPQPDEGQLPPESLPENPPEAPPETLSEPPSEPSSETLPEEKDPECSDLLPRPSWMLARVLALDVAATSALAVCATPDAPLGVARPLLKLLEISCHGVPWLLLAVGLIVTGLPSSASTHLHLLTLLLVDLAVVGVIKATVRRPRPVVNVDDLFLTVSIDNYSFPSGHATRAVLLLFYLCLEYFSSCTELQTVVILWSTTVIVSRVLIGRHHVLDVLVGCLLATLVYTQLLPHFSLSPTLVEEIVKVANQRQWLLDNLPSPVSRLL